MGRCSLYRDLGRGLEGVTTCTDAGLSLKWHKLVGTCIVILFRMKAVRIFESVSLSSHYPFHTSCRATIPTLVCSYRLILEKHHHIFSSSLIPSGSLPRDIQAGIDNLTNCVSILLFAQDSSGVVFVHILFPREKKFSWSNKEPCRLLDLLIPVRKIPTNDRVILTATDNSSRIKL